MIPSSYEGPSNGDYVAYVDELLRASPEYRRTQRSITGAMRSAVITPGGQSGSPVAKLRESLQKAKDMAEQQAKRQSATQQTTANRTASRTAGAPPVYRGKTITKEEAQQRLRALDREIENQKAQASTKKQPWVSPVSLALIVGGVIIGQFVSGFGTMLSIMGLMTLVGGVLNRLKAK